MGLPVRDSPGLLRGLLSLLLPRGLLLALASRDSEGVSRWRRGSTRGEPWAGTESGRGADGEEVREGDAGGSEEEGEGEWGAVVAAPTSTYPPESPPSSISLFPP